MKSLVHKLFSLILLVGLYAASYSVVVADTYSYVGTNYIVSPSSAYTGDMKLTGSITTNGPIPDNSLAFDISAIATSWSFSDGLQTIDSTN